MGFGLSEVGLLLIILMISFLDAEDENLTLTQSVSTSLINKDGHKANKRNVFGVFQSSQYTSTKCTIKFSIICNLAF